MKTEHIIAHTVATQDLEAAVSELRRQSQELRKLADKFDRAADSIAEGAATVRGIVMEGSTDD